VDTRTAFGSPTLRRQGRVRIPNHSRQPPTSSRSGFVAPHVHVCRRRVASRRRIARCRLRLLFLLFVLLEPEEKRDPPGRVGIVERTLGGLLGGARRFRLLVLQLDLLDRRQEGALGRDVALGAAAIWLRSTAWIAGSEVTRSPSRTVTVR
jgi:hypothetical protein